MLQEIVYQSLQGVRDNDMAKASSSNYPKHYPEPGEGSRSSTVRNPSNSMSFKSQLSLDEALARELQYQEDNLAATSLFGTERSAGRVNPCSKFYFGRRSLSLFFLFRDFINRCILLLSSGFLFESFVCSIACQYLIVLSIRQNFCFL